MKIPMFNQIDMTVGSLPKKTATCISAGIVIGTKGTGTCNVMKTAWEGGAGETDGCVGKSTSFAEDPHSVPSIHLADHNHLEFQFQGSDALTNKVHRHARR